MNDQERITGGPTRPRIATIALGFAVLLGSLGGCASTGEDDAAIESQAMPPATADATADAASQPASESIEAPGPSAKAPVAPSGAMRITPSRVTLSEESRAVQMESFDTVYETVRDRHWDEARVGAAWRASYEALRPRLQTVNSQREARVLMNELLDTLGQSHFGVFAGPTNKEVLVGGDDPQAPVASGAKPATAPDSQPSASDDTSEGFAGFIVTVVEERVMVTRVAEHSPAARAGLQLGWEVLAVDGKPISPIVAENRPDEGELFGRLKAQRAVTRFITGPRDTVRTLRVLDRQERRRDVEIRMITPEGEAFRMGEQLSLPTRTETRTLDGDVLYFALSAFGNPAPVLKEFGALLSDNADAPGIVIDVRGNPGGIGAMASGLAGFFIEERGQHLGRMVMRGGTMKFIVFPRAETFAGRVAVLIDGGSASTSEIFAGGLQDLGRARVFGETTAGAVLPSEISTLPNGDGFQFATADFETPKGTRLEGRGAIPDVTVPPSVEALRRGEDRALEAARQWILASDS